MGKASNPAEVQTRAPPPTNQKQGGRETLEDNSDIVARKTQKREPHRRRKVGNKTDSESGNENDKKASDPVSDVVAVRSRKSIEKPSYWTSTKARGFRVYPIPHKSKLFNTFRGVLETDKPEQLNIGRDVKEKGEYSSLNLVGVWRVQNAAVWDAYAAEKCRMRKELKKNNLTAPHFYMRQNLYDSLGSLPGYDQLSEDINETYLIHGTAPQFVKQILQNGLTPPNWECDALFGKGIYFAEDSCKNDQYGVGDTWRSNDDLHSFLFPHGKSEFRFPEPPYKAYYILLCRVIIGYHVSVTCTEATSKTMENNFHPGHAIFANDEERELAFCPSNDPKDRSRNTKRVPADSAVRYHCLVAKKGGAIVRFREFCQFHGNRVYPEYLICYTRK